MNDEDCAESSGPSAEMPRYKCHKEVWALKIHAIESAPADQERVNAGGDWYLIPEEPGYGKVLVGHDDYVVKHKPQVGGYYVVYADGYRSFSPAKAFEEGYLPETPMLAKGVTSAGAAVEADIIAAGKTAPRITPADIEANIVSEHYFTAAEGSLGAVIVAAGSYEPTIEEGAFDAPKRVTDLLTFCVLVLRNGFTVTGESACASPENFDAEIGRKIARANAVAKCWPLLGYELRTRLSQG